MYHFEWFFADTRGLKDKRQSELTDSNAIATDWSSSDESHFPKNLLSYWTTKNVIADGKSNIRSTAMNSTRLSFCVPAETKVKTNFTLFPGLKDVSSISLPVQVCFPSMASRETRLCSNRATSNSPKPNGQYNNHPLWKRLEKEPETSERGRW